MGICYQSHTTYHQRVLGTVSWTYPVEDLAEPYDNGQGVKIFCWDDSMNAQVILDLRLGRDGVERPIIIVDAPPEIFDKCAVYEKVNDWMSEVTSHAKSAMELQPGKRVTVSPRCHKFPRTAGVVTIVERGNGQWGPWAHLLADNGVLFKHISVNFITLVDPDKYNCPPCPWGEDEQLLELLQSAKLMIKEGPGFWLIVADRMEEIGHQIAWAVRSVANQMNSKV